MSDLPVNYLDDILAESMGGKRKFKITHANGSTEEVTIEDISEYAQIGSTFGAGDINKTNQAVNEKFDSGDVVDPMLTTEEGFAADAYKTKVQFDEQNKNLQGVKFNVDQNGKIISYTTETGGADTVFPFSDTSDATATAAHLTVGQTAYVNGVKITGTRPAPVTRQSGTFSGHMANGVKTQDVVINFPSNFDKTPTMSFGSMKGNAPDGGFLAISVSVKKSLQSNCTVTVSSPDNIYGGCSYSFAWTAQA